MLYTLSKQPIRCRKRKSEERVPHTSSLFRDGCLTDRADVHVNDDVITLSSFSDNVARRSADATCNRDGCYSFGRYFDPKTDSLYTNHTATHGYLHYYVAKMYLRTAILSSTAKTCCKHLM